MQNYAGNSQRFDKDRRQDNRRQGLDDRRAERPDKRATMLVCMLCLIGGVFAGIFIGLGIA